MKLLRVVFLAVLVGLPVAPTTYAGLATSAVRETAEAIMKKFGRGAAGQTVDEIAATTSKAVAKYGDEAIPFLKSSGHQGFKALEEAGEQGPDVIKLFAKKGDEAIWIISEPKKLSIFLKHGESAADALLKHPGIADSLIGKYGDEAVGALNSVSRQGGQRLGIVAEEGILSATPRSPELFSVIRRYGDEAMDFIWKNKGALTVAAALGKFLQDPEAYFSGAKRLIVDPVVGPMAQSVNWTFIVAGALAILFLPFIVRRFSKARSAGRQEGRKA